MKSASKIAAAAALFLLFSQTTVTALAQTATPATLLPSTVDMTIDINTTVDNPLVEMVQDPNGPFHFLLEQIERELSETEQEGFDKLIEILQNTQLTFAIDENLDTFPAETFYLTLEMTDEDFSIFKNILPDTTNTYRDLVTYFAEPDVFATYTDGLYIMTSALESLEKAIDNTFEETNSLANNEAYLEAESHQLQDAFLNMFFQYPEFLSEINNDFALGPPSDLITHVGLSLAQQEGGLGFSAYIKGDPEVIESMDMPFNKYNFTPHLYKNINGKDIITFSENSNLQAQWEDTLTFTLEDPTFTEMYNEFLTWFNENTATDFENDLLPLLDDGYIVAAHNHNTLFPSMTLGFDVSDEKDEAKKVLSMLNGYMRTNLKNNDTTPDGTQYYTYQQSTIASTTFYQHIFDLGALLNDDQLMAMDPSFSEMRLSFGITTDGVLLITTHPDLYQLTAGNGMLSNESFAELFMNPDEEISELDYVDMTELHGYIVNLMKTMDPDDEDLTTFFNGFLGPWQDIYAKSYADETSSWIRGTARVNIQGLYAYDELFDDYFTPIFRTTSELTEFDESMISKIIDPGFCDVVSEDWHFVYITELVNFGIVEGYPDHCFRPDKDITRAEFLKMAIEGADMNDLFPYAAMSDQDQYFSDVSADDWYAHYVNQAAANGKVDGYDDGTFRPNEPISRAEAVQILYDLHPVLQEGLVREPFDDVSADDWFADAVGALYHGGLINGREPTIFAPQENITRAESAKIVSLFIDYPATIPVPIIETDTIEQLEPEPETTYTY